MSPPRQRPPRPNRGLDLLGFQFEKHVDRTEPRQEARSDQAHVSTDDRRFGARRYSSSWLKLAPGAVAFLSTLTLCNVCGASDPSLWDGANNPRLARDVHALRTAEHIFLQARADPSAHAMTRFLRALRILENVDAASSPDPRVRFLYGRLLVRANRDARAVEVLHDAIAFAPHHPSVGDAMFSLAIGLARLGRTEEEIRTYDAWLERESSREARSIGLSNQAESFMVVERLDDAVRCYREAIALRHDNALAHWGLALALDRSGDPGGAMQRAAMALKYDPEENELRGPHVFFVPRFDLFWYRALGAMARAQSAQEGRTRSLWWERAILLWQQYLDAAPADGRWVAIARARSESCKRSARKSRGLWRGRDRHARP